MTLTETSKIARRGVVIFFVLAFTYYISLLLFYPMIKGFIERSFPPKDPPNPEYGSLPPLEFVEKKLKEGSKPVYKLDTKDGKLPKDTYKKLPVYKMSKPVISFEKGKDAIRTAAAFGFTDDDMITNLKATTYKWSKMQSGGTLEIILDTKEVNMQTPIKGKAQFFPQGALSKDGFKSEAVNFMSSIGRLNDPLYKEGSQTVTMGRFVGNTLIKTDSTSEAQIARVDFFRKLYDWPILGPDPREGLIYTYLRKPDFKDMPYYNYPIAQTHVWNVQPKTSASYPIIPIAEAWRIVSQGGGVIVNVTPEAGSNLLPYTAQNVENIFISNIYLAYYDNVKFQEYLQPIYVFEGKYTTLGTRGGNIALYYPAISPELIKRVSQ